MSWTMRFQIVRTFGQLFGSLFATGMVWLGPFVTGPLQVMGTGCPWKCNLHKDFGILIC